MWESFISFQNERLKKSKSPSLGGWGCCKSSSLLAPYSLLLLHHFGHTQTIFVFCQLIVWWIGKKKTFFHCLWDNNRNILLHCLKPFLFMKSFDVLLCVYFSFCSVKRKLCSVENIVGLRVFIIFCHFSFFFSFSFWGLVRSKLV